MSKMAKEAYAKALLKVAIVFMAFSETVQFAWSFQPHRDIDLAPNSPGDALKKV